MVRKAIYTPLSVPEKIKNSLRQLKKDDLLSYAEVIEYLLIKSGHVDPSDSDLHFEAVDRMINGGV